MSKCPRQVRPLLVVLVKCQCLGVSNAVSNCAAEGEGFCKVGSTNIVPSMYGLFTYIWLIFMVNVGKYTIHIHTWMVREILYHHQILKYLDCTPKQKKTLTFSL